MMTAQCRMMLSMLFGAILCYSATCRKQATSVGDALDGLTRKLATAHTQLSSCRDHSESIELRNRIGVLKKAIECEKVRGILKGDLAVVAPLQTGTRFHLQIIKPDPTADYKITKVKRDSTVDYKITQVTPPDEDEFIVFDPQTGKAYPATKETVMRAEMLKEWMLNERPRRQLQKQQALEAYKRNQGSKLP